MSQVMKVVDGGLVATLHLPRESGRRPAVIVLSGSMEASQPRIYLASRSPRQGS
jgi:hypothetical protein